MDNKRSALMARVRSKNTKPELIVRKMLFSMGFRYRVHVGSLPGKPDIVLPKYNTVIFTNGCFWHSHECLKGQTKPKTNIDFWVNKIKGNIKRDHENEKKLKDLGWNVSTIWECQTKDKRCLKEIIQNILPKK